MILVLARQNLDHTQVKLTAEFGRYD